MATATFFALGVQRRLAMLEMLELIVDDWRRVGGPLAAAADRALRPISEYMRSEMESH